MREAIPRDEATIRFSWTYSEDGIYKYVSGTGTVGRTAQYGPHDHEGWSPVVFTVVDVVVGAEGPQRQDWMELTVRADDMDGFRWEYVT